MSKKIIISLKEAETLIHKGSLILNRKILTSANNNYRVKLILNKENTLTKNGCPVFLFSDIHQFEIFEIDLISFLNHYKVPPGLLKIKKSVPKFITKNKENLQLEITDEPSFIDNGGYMKLRNGLLGILHTKFKIQARLKKSFEVERNLHSILIMSAIRKQLIMELIDKDQFPLMDIKGEKNMFVSDISKRIVWWGHFVKENYLNKFIIDDNDVISTQHKDDLKPISKGEIEINNKSTDKSKTQAESRVKEIRGWMGNFLKLDDANLLNKQLADIPEEMVEEIDFLLGYCLAAFFYNTYQTNDFFLEKQYESVIYKNKNELFFWVSFFISFFRQDSYQLYFIKSLNHTINQLEIVAYELSQNKLEIGDKTYKDFIFKEIDREIQITEYLELSRGFSNNNLKIIKKEQAKEIFKNNLFKDQLPMVGMEKKSVWDNKGDISNICSLINNQVHITYNILEDAEVIFYLDRESEMKNELINRRFKVKETNDLIDKNKRVLLIFIKEERTSALFPLYIELIKGNKLNKINKVVILFLVDTQITDIRSLEFDSEVKKKKVDYANLFGTEVEMIVKDINSNDDSEVKRNLKNVLKDYKINQIEVMDDNFDNENATWVLDVNSEYFVENETQNYYSFFS